MFWFQKNKFSRIFFIALASLHVEMILRNSIRIDFVLRVLKYEKLRLSMRMIRDG